MAEGRQSPALVLICLPVFYLLWIIFTGTFSLHELLIGILGTLLATVGLFVIDLQYPAIFSPTVSDLLQIWRIPWYLVRGTWEVLLVAAKDLIGVGRAKSLFRIAPFDAGKKDDARATARRVLAVSYTTIAPNFIVLGINASDSNLLFHQIERSSVPRMTQNLGAAQ